VNASAAPATPGQGDTLSRSLPRSAAALGWARRWCPAPATLVALCIIGIGLGLRLKIAAHSAAFPWIDENEVVEQAVAFMGGDLRYHFLKYGPLTMYVLAAIYHGVAALRGMTGLEYASRVFFDGAEHYFIARAYAACWVSLLALVAFFAFRRHSGVPAALLVCTLLGLPFVDTLVRGVRIDMPQAALQGLSLLALGEVTMRPRARYWLLAGACAGLSIATKPMPGALILPSFVLASWFAGKRDPAGTERRVPARLRAALVSAGPWLAALACIGCAVLGNPAMLEPRHFIESQRTAIALHSGEVNWSHQSIGESALHLGVPFLVGLGLALLLVCIRRDPKAWLTAFFLATYLGAFWGRPSRNYYLVAAAVAACLLLGHGLSAALQVEARRRGRSRLGSIWLPLAVLFVLVPVRDLWARSSGNSSNAEARQWMYENVPAGTRLFHVGRSASGPRLVAMDKALQARWGGHFDYGRKAYVFLQEAFDRGYADYENSGRPRYAITVHDATPPPRGSKEARPITDSLLKKARSKNWRYIVLAGFKGQLQDLAYPWFEHAILEKQFGSIAIFRVPEATDPANAVSEPTPAAP
jgi:hypothetical protein